jgi:hypothetical protein
MDILKATIMVSLSTYSTKSLVQYLVENLWAVEKIKHVNKLTSTDIGLSPSLWILSAGTESTKVGMQFMDSHFKV